MRNIRHTILVVDDDIGIRHTLRAIFKDDFIVLTVGSGKDALTLARKHNIDVVILDIMLPDISGIDLLKKIKESYIDMEVIMISALKEIETAVAAMKEGAFDFITKTFEVEDLKLKVWKVIESLKQKKKMMYLKDEVERHLDEGIINSKSYKMQEIGDLIKKVSRLPTTILLLGESGTGKEILARAIWRESGLKDAPFIAVNLASIPAGLIESILFGHEKGAFSGAHKQHLGKFELADNGFLFLDEIGDLQLDLQAKLLRAIQEGEIERVGGDKSITVNVRLITATHADLDEKVQKKEFREDLFYRINVVPLKLPPLRERLEDVPVLANYFLKKYTKKFNRSYPKEISSEALKALAQYKWPGNIRELENLMERLVAVADSSIIGIKNIPIELQIGGIIDSIDDKDVNSPFQSAVSTFERNLLLHALQEASWNRTKAAQLLGIPLSTLKYKFRQYGIYDILEKKNL